MDTSTLQMALIGYQAERHKIEEQIAEIRAQLNRRSGRSRQASSRFSRADHGMPRANLDPDIVALPISRQAKYQQQWKRDGRCIQCGKQRRLDSAVYCPGCRTKNRVQARERMRRLTNAQRRNLGSISYREPSHERLIDLRKECSVEHRKTPEEPLVKGNTYFTLTVEGVNGYQANGKLGAPTGKIGMQFSFMVNSKGEVTVIDGETKGYPSASIYSYDSPGNATDVWQQTESGNIDDLNGPLKPANSGQANQFPQDIQEEANRQCKLGNPAACF